MDDYLRYILMNIHSSFINYASQMETTKMCDNWWLHKPGSRYSHKVDGSGDTLLPQKMNFELTILDNIPPIHCFRVSTTVIKLYEQSNMERKGFILAYIFWLQSVIEWNQGRNLRQDTTWTGEVDNIQLKFLWYDWMSRSVRWLRW